MLQSGHDKNIWMNIAPIFCITYKIYKMYYGIEMFFIVNINLHIKVINISHFKLKK